MLEETKNLLIDAYYACEEQNVVSYVVYGHLIIGWHHPSHFINSSRGVIWSATAADQSWFLSFQIVKDYVTGLRETTLLRDEGDHTSDPLWLKLTLPERHRR